MSLEAFKLDNLSSEKKPEIQSRVEKAGEKHETLEREKNKESIENKAETNHKKIFITGATGFVGSHTCMELLRQGHKLTVLVLPQEGVSVNEKVRTAFLPLCKDESEFLNLKKNVTVVQGDITEPNLGLETGESETMKDFDEIIHLAAKLSFRESDRQSVLRSNVFGTEQVLEFAKQSKARKVSFISTAYVSGNSEGVIKEELVPELSAPNFDNAYEKSKFVSEHKVAKWGAENKIPVAILRPSVVISKDYTDDTSGFYGFAAVLTKARRKAMLLDSKVEIPCNQSATLDLISVDDVARTVAKLSVQNPSSQLEVFHLTNPQYRTVKEIFDKSLELIGLDNKVKLVDKSIGEIKSEGEKITREILLKLKDLLPYLFTQATFDTKNISEKTAGEYAPERISDEFLENALHHVYTPDATNSWISQREEKRRPVIIPREFMEPVESGRIEQIGIDVTLALFRRAVGAILRPSGIPEVQSLYAKESPRYDRKHNLTTAFNDERMREYSAHKVAEYVDRLPISYTPKILDIATGTGLNLKKIYDELAHVGRKAELCGIDFTPEMLEQAKQRNLIHDSIHFERADATDMLGLREGKHGETYRFAENSIDCITTVFGIGGIPNSLKCFEEQLKILKSGGMSILIDMHAPNLTNEKIHMPLNIPSSPSLVKQAWEKVTKPIVLKKLWGWKDPTEDFYKMPLVTYHDERQNKYFGFEVEKRETENMKWWFGLPVMPVGRLVVRKKEIHRAEHLIKQEILESYQTSKV